MSLLLSWAVSASLILGAVLVLRLALGRFLSPRGRLLLWALAGARLALPVTFPSPLGDLWTRMAPLASPSAAVPSPSTLAQALPASPGAAAVGETAAASASFPLWAVVWGMGAAVLPEGWTPQVLIAGRVAMGEDDAMSWHDDDPSVQPGMIYFRDLPEGILDLTVTYTLFSPTGEAAGEGSWEWSDQTV